MRTSKYRCQVSRKMVYFNSIRFFRREKNCFVNVTNSFLEHFFEDLQQLRKMTLVALSRESTSPRSIFVEALFVRITSIKGNLETGLPGSAFYLALSKCFCMFIDLNYTVNCCKLYYFKANYPFSDPFSIVYNITCQI